MNYLISISALFSTEVFCNLLIKSPNPFLKLASKNKKKYLIYDNSADDINLEKRIFNVVQSKLKIK